MSKITYWTCVLKNIVIILLLIGAIFVGLKLAVFYLPFLIAFTLSLIIEPIIKFFMGRFGLTRKLSSIIVFFITFGIIIFLLILGITTIASESTNILENIDSYYDKYYSNIQYFIEKIDTDKFNISEELKIFIEKERRNSFK